MAPGDGAKEASGPTQWKVACQKTQAEAKAACPTNERAPRRPQHQVEDSAARPPLGPGQGSGSEGVEGKLTVSAPEEGTLNYQAPERWPGPSRERGMPGLGCPCNTS